MQVAPSGSQIWNYKTESISGSVVPLAMFISKNRERKKSSFESRIGSKKTSLFWRWIYSYAKHISWVLKYIKYIHGEMVGSRICLIFVWYLFDICLIFVKYLFKVLQYLFNICFRYSNICLILFNICFRYSNICLIFV